MDGFRVVGDRTVAAGSFFRYDRLHIDALGEGIVRDVIRHPGAVAIVPMIDGEVVLIRQYRAALDAELLEIPAGKLDEGEDPSKTAVRELVEEIGRRPGHLIPLAGYYATPGFCDEYLYVYLADDLEPAEATPHGPEEQVAELVMMPLVEAVRMAHDGRLHDSKTLIGILLAGHRLL